MNDFLLIINWWLLFFYVGIIFLPLTIPFFKSFYDSGYVFSKVIGVLVISYFVWILGSLKILPFSINTIILLLIISAAVNFFAVKKNKKIILENIRNKWKLYLLEEFLFLAALSLWGYVRGFQPDIEGLEKFMDFGFVNSILRNQYFPPTDMWMAGETINYYYFGHLVAAVLTKLSQIESAVTYNLMIATIFALGFVQTFSLSGNLIRNIIPSKKRAFLIGGFLSAFLLTLGGNLHTLWWFLTHNTSPDHLSGILKTITSGRLPHLADIFQNYWYPDATRFIVEKFGAMDNTIHEFPIYSFIVSDLHGHVSDIPFVLLFLALVFSLLQVSAPNKKFSVFNFQFSVPLALTLAVMYMTNAWDMPIYYSILGLVVLYLNYLKSGFSFQTFKNTFVFSILVFIFALLFSLPFHLHFAQIGKGIGLVNAHSPFWQLLVLWGYPWLISLAFFVFIFRFHLLTLLSSFLRRLNFRPLFGLIQGKIISKFKLLPADVFVIILVIVATGLIAVPEFIYLKDIYIASYHRANTVFKLVYQSFMMYSLAIGYIIVRILSGLENKIIKLVFTFYFLLFTFFIIVYPFLAVPSYYQGLRHYQELWGLSFMKNSYQDNFEAVNWLNKNVTGTPTILEATGDSYTIFNQISMATGLPTVEGWLVHEWLWRGAYDEPGERAGEVKIIYETKEKKITSELLKKYKVKYVIVGSLERQKYQIEDRKFQSLGKVVFTSGNTRIYLID